MPFKIPAYPEKILTTADYNKLKEENEQLKAKLDKLKAIFSEAPDMYARELEIINQ